MKTFQLQSSFNNGVLSAGMVSRLDIKQYFQGLKQGTNIKCLPQGGIKRRPGTKYITRRSETVVRLLPFVFNTDQYYVVEIDDTYIRIYRNDVLVDTILSPYDDADLPDLDFAQTADTMIIVHEDYAPRKLVRGSSDSAFSISTISFDYTPLYDFNDSSSPTPTSEIQTIEFDSDHDDGDTFKLTLEGVQSEDISFLVDDSTDDQDEMENRLLEGLRNMENIPYTGVTVEYLDSSGDGKYTITFAGAAAKDWGLLGYVKVYDSGTSAINNATIVRTQAGSSRSEAVWSSTRGWPRTVSFFEGRLWFGGSRQRPHTLWGSRVNDFFNFDPGSSRADQAIDVTLDTDQINRIQALVARTTLQVFTIGGEFVFRTDPAEPITPENVAVVSHTQYGSLRIQPVTVGGSTLFLQRTGKALREFSYVDEKQGYIANSLTLMASHIINDPVAMAIQQGSTSEDATYVYVVNGDGTIGVFNSDPRNEIAAWTVYELSLGDFTDIVVVNDIVYANIVYDGHTYLVKFDEDYYTDIGYQQSSETPFSYVNASITDLEGVEATVVVDDYKVLPPQVYASDGDIDLPYSVTYAEGGIGFDVTVETMPVAQDQGAGHNLYDKKRISRVTVEFLDSMGVKVEGYDMGLSKSSPETGRKSITLMGWSKAPTVTLTQTDPLPMTILGLNMEVNG